MSSFERRVYFCVAVYTVFLSLACPMLCVVFFKYLQKEEAIAATIILFMFCSVILMACYGILHMNEPNRPRNIAKGASADADHIARKILVENLYKQLKNQKVNSHE